MCTQPDPRHARSLESRQPDDTMAPVATGQIVSGGRGATEQGPTSGAAPSHEGQLLAPSPTVPPTIAGFDREFGAPRARLQQDGRRSPRARAPGTSNRDAKPWCATSPFRVCKAVGRSLNAG